MVPFKLMESNNVSKQVANIPCQGKGEADMQRESSFTSPNPA